MRYLTILISVDKNNWNQAAPLKTASDGELIALGILDISARVGTICLRLKWKIHDV
jgi:hypothetical protein